LVDVTVGNVVAADVTNAGMYLFFETLIGIAGIIALLVFVIVLGYILGKIGFADWFGLR